MTWLGIRQSSGIAMGLWLAACGSNGGEDGDSSVDTTDTEPSSSSDTGTADAGTADSGGADSGSESGDTGEPLPQCPAPDESVAAGFSVELDGTPVVLDSSGSASSVSGLPEDWMVRDGLPEIDDMCDVVEQVPGSLTLACTDTMGIERTLTLHLASSEALSTDVGAGPAHLHYTVNLAHDMLEHVSDSVAHAFVLSDDAGIALAGIDGHYSFEALLSEAWPQWPDVVIRHGECAGPHYQAEFELEDGSTVVLPHGSAGDLGEYRVLVETADETTEFDGEFDLTVQTARWLLGRPE
jgi:hypothetical protein